MITTSIRRTRSFDWDFSAVFIRSISKHVVASSQVVVSLRISQFESTVSLLSMQNIYPERLCKTYVINAPMIFTGMWRIIKSFLDPVVASKVDTSSAQS